MNSSNFSNFLSPPSEESKLDSPLTQLKQTQISVFDHPNEILELIAQYSTQLEFSRLSQISRRIQKISKSSTARKFSNFIKTHESSQCYLPFINMKEKCYLRSIVWYFYSDENISPPPSSSGILQIGDIQFHEICPLLEEIKLVIGDIDSPFLQNSEVMPAYRRCLNSLAQCKNLRKFITDGFHEPVEELGKLKQINYLDIYYNSTTRQSNQLMARVFNEIPQLTYLELSDISSEFFESLKKFPALTELFLAKIPNNEAEFSLFPSIFSHLQKLSIFPNHDDFSFPTWSNFRFLHTLKIFFFTEGKESLLTPSLAKIPSLKNFHISFSEDDRLIHLIDWKILFLFLENNSQLTRLEFISDEPIEMKENISCFISLIHSMKNFNSLIIPNYSLESFPYRSAYLKYFTDRGKLKDEINGRIEFLKEILESEKIQSTGK